MAAPCPATFSLRTRRAGKCSRLAALREPRRFKRPSPKADRGLVLPLGEERGFFDEGPAGEALYEGRSPALRQGPLATPLARRGLFLRESFFEGVLSSRGTGGDAFPGSSAGSDCNRSGDSSSAFDPCSGFASYPIGFPGCASPADP